MGLLWRGGRVHGGRPPAAGKVTAGLSWWRRRVGESVTHVKINNDGECLSLLGAGDETFATLTELVRHYTDDKAKQLRDTAGNVIELKYPLPAVDHYSER